MKSLLIGWAIAAAMMPVMGAQAQVETSAAVLPSEGAADTLAAHGRYLAAIAVYTQLPPTAENQNKLGMAYEHMRMAAPARAAFQSALKIDARFAEAYNNMGTLEHSTGNLKQAEKMYRKALKLKPGMPNTLQNLGTLYYAQGKYKKGDAEYRKALEIDPMIMERNRGQGIQTQTSGRGVSEIHYHLAANYAQAGNGKLAMDYLRRAITEGFTDRNRLLHDKEFADLRTSDAFLQMVDDLKRN
jgi:tetratricopeptide (TPR) repeat protein